MHDIRILCISDDLLLSFKLGEHDKSKIMLKVTKEPWQMFQLQLGRVVFLHLQRDDGNSKVTSFGAGSAGLWRLTGK